MEVRQEQRKRFKESLGGKFEPFALQAVARSLWITAEAQATRSARDPRGA